MQDSALKLQKYKTSNLIKCSKVLGWKNIEVQKFREEDSAEYLFVPQPTDPYIVLITQGSLHLESRRDSGRWQSANLSPGFLTFTSDRRPSEIRWWSKKTTPIFSAHVSIKPSLIDQIAIQNTKFDPTSIEFPDRIGVEDSMIREICHCLLSELDVDAEWPMYAESLGLLLGVHILKNYCSKKILITSQKGKFSYQQWKIIRAYIHDNLEKSIHLDDLAGLLSMSTFHFLRLFKSTSGFTPHQYLIRIRLHHAQQLLQNSKLNIEEVAFRTGFSSGPHLTSAITRFLKLTPSKLRKNS